MPNARALLMAIAMAALMQPDIVAAQSAPRRNFQTEVVDIPTRPGTVVRSAYWRAVSPPGNVGVAVLLLAGGTGQLRIASNGAINGLTQNFLIRSRESFIAEGVDFVAAVDAPADRAQGMNATFRLSPTHTDDVAKVIEDIRAKTGMPVWLVGTSAGTLSAVGIATRLGYSSSEVSGLVLTSSMSHVDAEGRCGKSVFDANLGAFRRPVLVVAHANDGCVCTPAANADAILAKFANAPRREKKIFIGGSPPQSKACEARSEHGFFGLEDEVVRYIVGWMKSAQSR